ncbi:MAG TPA: 3-phosphoshikimate 1-carboxyvinyltransferase [Burkholderiaceae bacterium]|nr:3-phosphoshikimate 1-carboxyvinyltransferase [Burkholderiaceae bacterium]
MAAADPGAGTPRPWPPELDIAPIHEARGAVRVPGSKSISNRALLLAALAAGTTDVEHLLDADDTQVMLAALATLGVRIERSGATCRVAGCGGRFPVRSAELFLGNAGTAMRPLAAQLAFADGRYRLDGVPRMRERPIGDLVDALNAVGARVGYLGTPGYPPLQIEPASAFRTDVVRVRGDVSSQFVSGLLMAAPLAAPAGGVTVAIEGNLISQPYVALTVALMRQFGADVQERAPSQYIVARGGYRSPGRFPIEGDASSASYFVALGAIAGGPVRIDGVGRDSIQGDIGFLDLATRMGARIVAGPDWIEASCPDGGSGLARLRAVDVDCTRIPDAAMTAAVMALFADGRTTLRGIGSWRVKETDRIAAMAAELRKLGAGVEHGDDWLSVEPPFRLQPATIETYDDHRIAMCFALCAAGGATMRIRDPRCVAKTYPGFFDALDRLTRSPR